MNGVKKIYPSLLAADFTHLGVDILRVEKTGAHGLHLDVMDGHFVPNLSMGPAVVSAVRRSTKLFLDVHLMIYNPFDFIEPFVRAGADQINFHIEATEDVKETLAYIRKCHIKAGLALSPETPAEMLLPYQDMCDQLLLMTVHPGFGGQSFIPSVLDKIAFLRKEVPSIDIAVDGGITLETARQCQAAGGNVFVTGTYFFEGNDMEKRMQALKEL